MIVTNYNFREPIVLKDLGDKLKNDLVVKMDLIFKKIQTPTPTSSAFLQSAQNSLRKSVEHICIDDQPFFKNDGQCRGISEWAIALYLNFKKKYPHISTQASLIAIASEFSEGAGIQPALLQKYATEQLLDSLNVKVELKHELNLKNKKDKEIMSELMKKMGELEDGVYRLSFSGLSEGYFFGFKQNAIPGHGTVIIVENNNYYFLDPNAGLMGTGRDIGTENKVSDVLLFLLLCKHYAPFESAYALCQKGIEQFAATLDKQKEHIVRTVFPPLLSDLKKADKAHFCVWDLIGICMSIEQVIGTHFSEDEKGEMHDFLAYQPFFLQSRLEQSYSLRFNKYIFT